MDRAGLDPLPLPDLGSLSYERTLSGVQNASSEASRSFGGLFAALKRYKDGARSRSLAATVPASKKAFYEENSHVLVNELQSIPYYLNPVIDELNLPEKRIFFLTGRAGQGKTNLLCDLVEKFLTKHEIPCVFLSARELGLKQSNDLAQTICDHLFSKKIATLEEGIDLLSKEALRLNKPFILVIDGLNEHHDISLFAQQLETVVDSLLQHPGVKCLFSCRSEFFEQRFTALINGHLRPEIFVCSSTERRLEEEEKSELVDIYFEFFSVDRNRVAKEVREVLTNDMLLLRFFCEVYGARDKEADYVQPDVQHFYREELFQRYLEQKLHTAEIFLQSVTTTFGLESPTSKLLRVLEICADQMITQVGSSAMSQ